MSELRQSLEDYLAIRRSLGFKLARAEKLLNQFLDHMEDLGAALVTTDVAVAWATRPRTAPAAGGRIGSASYAASPVTCMPSIPPIRSRLPTWSPDAAVAPPLIPIHPTTSPG